MLVLWVLLGLFAVLGFFIVGLFVLPIRLHLTAEKAETSRVCVDVWLFGGFAPRLRVIDSARLRKARAKTPDARVEKPKRDKKRKAFRLPGGKKAARRMIREVPRLIAAEFRRIHFDRLEVDGDFGLGDPADTGMVYGLLTPFLHARRSPKFVLNLRPDFTGARLEGTVAAALHLTLGALFVPVVQFGWRVWVER